MVSYKQPMSDERYKQLLEQYRDCPGILAGIRQAHAERGGKEPFNLYEWIQKGCRK
jgi:hypothetical protein